MKTIQITVLLAISFLFASSVMAKGWKGTVSRKGGKKRCKTELGTVAKGESIGTHNVLRVTYDSSGGCEVFLDDAGTANRSGAPMRLKGRTVIIYPKMKAAVRQDVPLQKLAALRGYDLSKRNHNNATTRYKNAKRQYQIAMQRLRAAAANFKRSQAQYAASTKRLNAAKAKLRSNGVQVR